MKLGNEDNYVLGIIFWFEPRHAKRLLKVYFNFYHSISHAQGPIGPSSLVLGYKVFFLA